MYENHSVITDGLLEAFLQYKYKARRRALGRTGEPTDFDNHRTSQARAHRAQAQTKLFPPPEAALAPRQEAPPGLLDATTLKQGQTRLQNVRVQSANLACAICEFRSGCKEEARKIDYLSLLAGPNPVTL